jgi:hypothetical protein
LLLHELHFAMQCTRYFSITLAAEHLFVFVITSRTSSVCLIYGPSWITYLYLYARICSVVKDITLFALLLVKHVILSLTQTVSFPTNWLGRSKYFHLYVPVFSYLLRFFYVFAVVPKYLSLQSYSHIEVRKDFWCRVCLFY